MVVHPLDESISCLINVCSGKLAASDKNVDSAVELGASLAHNFMLHCPEGFHNPIKEVVKTVTAQCQNLSINAQQMQLEPALLYSRLPVLSRKRNISLQMALTYELATVPLNLFTADGSMCSTQTSQLYQTIAVKAIIEQPVCLVIVDGNPVFYHTKWPALGSKVLELVYLFVALFGDELNKHDMDIVFDSYADQE